MEELEPLGLTRDLLVQGAAVPIFRGALNLKGKM
jgi:hypothetical protein